jgi:membrane-associated phospholipid phosphatase
MNTPGFSVNPAYGDYKDKRADVKFRLMREGDWVPEIAIGTHDVIGTRLFAAEYVVANKRFGDAIDISLGYGPRSLSGFGISDTGVVVKRNRLGGFFGGVRATVNDSFSLVAERDPVDYAREPNADTTRIENRRNNTSIGIEYRWGWLGVQASRQGEEWGINTWLQVPLNEREFVPKINEPEPYTRLTPRPSLAQWRSDRRYEREMRRVLSAEEFGGVILQLDDDRVLRLSLGHPRISHMARAVGRAARIALLLSPLETREIHITYQLGALPFATYVFSDLDRLRRYFNGTLARRELAATVEIRHAGTGAIADSVESGLAGWDDEAQRPWITTSSSDDEAGNFLAFRRRDNELGMLELVPVKLGSIINDPSGFYQFQLYSEATWTKAIGSRTYLDAGMTLQWFDTFNHSALVASNNSTLPHVRTDVANYIDGNRFRLDHLTVSRYFPLAPAWYGRLSGGLYEMMFSGVGGQLLFAPERSRWAADVSVDALRQRDYSGWLGHLPYSTITALGALHYRFSNGVTATARAGKFLARDVGVRLELSRHFASGVEMGAWLTATDNNDFNASGSQGKAYKDKGVFVNIPFDVMLTRDSRAKGSLALAEWNRDVGRMVDAPGDLYGMFEKSLMDREDRDGLSRFGDVDDDYPVPSPGSRRGLLDRPLMVMARDDARYFAGLLGSASWWSRVGLGIGVIAASSALDNRGYRFGIDNGDKRWVRYGRNVGNLLPLAFGGASLALALDGHDRRLADSSVAALQAGAMALLGSEAIKRAIHRSRPEEGKGSGDFNASSRSDSSLPSNTTALTWALITPYAREYDAPWLYGVAALTNFARISGNKHWVSDTVAGTALGYALGSLFWELRRNDAHRDAELALAPNQVRATWHFR